MLLLTAKIRPAGTAAPFVAMGVTDRVTTVSLPDGRYVDVRVEEVAVAFEIEEVKRA